MSSGVFVYLFVQINCDFPLNPVNKIVTHPDVYLLHISQPALRDTVTIPQNISHAF